MHASSMPIPLRSAKPVPASQEVFGISPAQVTTKSAVNTSPLERATPLTGSRTRVANSVVCTIRTPRSTARALITPLRYEPRTGSQGRIDIDHGDGNAARNAGTGDFHPEESRADNDHRGGGVQAWAQCARIIERPQLEFAALPGGGDATGFGAACDDQRTVGKGVAISDYDRASVEISGHRSGTHASDVEIIEP